jgi:hypothetical protein
MAEKQVLPPADEEIEEIKHVADADVDEGEEEDPSYSVDHSG